MCNFRSIISQTLFFAGNDDESLNFLGTLDDLCFLDFRVCVQELLDFSRIDIFASADNHVFDPSLYLAVAKLVQTGNIAVEYSIR